MRKITDLYRTKVFPTIKLAEKEDGEILLVVGNLLLEGVLFFHSSIATKLLKVGRV